MSTTPEVSRSVVTDTMLRVVRLVLSLLYVAVWWGWVELFRALTRRTRGTGVVLYYHSVPLRYKDQFERQMRTVQKHARAVALDGLGQLAPGTHSVAITFDDGLVSFLENAVPVLQTLNLPATVFVVAAVAPTMPTWGEHYYDKNERVMSAEQLRSLPDMVAIGSHTLTHPHLPALDEESVAREVVESRASLEGLLQRPVTTFSFPYGEFDACSIESCRKAGYERVFSTVPVLVRSADNAYLLGRVSADPWDWPLEFRLKLSGAYCWEAHYSAFKARIKNSRSKVKSPGRKTSSRPLDGKREPLDSQETAHL